MSETGELPCIYCGTEPPPLDDYGRVSCCQAGRDVSELAATVDSFAKALNYYADPRHHEGEVIVEGIRHPTAVAGPLAQRRDHAVQQVGAAQAAAHQPDRSRRPVPVV